MKTPPSDKIAVFISFSGMGGAERMVFKLCEAFAQKGYSVDLLLIKTFNPHSPILPKHVNIIHLNAASTMASLPALIRYLRRHRPRALLAAKDRANRVAILAKILSQTPCNLIVRMGTHTSTFLKNKSSLAKLIRLFPMKWLYPKADGIVSVSKSVAADVSELTGISVSDIHVIANPTLFPEIYEMSEQPVAHAWLAPGSKPVIIGAGRLTPQKDFPTLIRAFAEVRKQMPAKLIILGEGKRRNDLTALTEALNIAEDVDLVGFVSNPYAYMRRADLFVLSSAWEGMGNVLIEAMALGVPVISTDCPGGLKEITNPGQNPYLVPVGDAAAMADAIYRRLSAFTAGEPLTPSVKDFHTDKSAAAYLKVLLGPSTR